MKIFHCLTAREVFCFAYHCYRCCSGKFLLEETFTFLSLFLPSGVINKNLPLYLVLIAVIYDQLMSVYCALVGVEMLHHGELEFLKGNVLTVSVPLPSQAILSGI